MAAKFDLTAVARSLLNIEVNTIVRDNMTGEPMPPLPHALLDIARDYANELCSLGVDLADWFAPGAGDPEKVGSRWTNAPASVSGQLSISVPTFDRLRWAAKWAAASTAARPAPLPSAKRVLIERIINNADAIKAMFPRFDKRFQDQFLNKTRDDLAGVDIESGSYAVSAADLSLLQKIWDLGVEEIVAQTVVHVTGDVTTRVQEAFRNSGSEPLFGIHRQSVDVSVACWKNLLDAVREIAGATVGALLGRP
ncbi:MAG TPA: hypothetical protein VFE12_11495 [Acetobacteraceae bacterium]|jgi:hypothetical protein|nr:hypothetical protein [Acetobacteraceae bacterium]